MKRILDVVIACSLFVLVSPLNLFIALVLACTGERKIFFAQPRIGLFGKPFDLLKFATMLEDSPNLGTGTLTVPNDPRVLPIGRVLRKTKLNELPQLWNVIRGDMSLVGPRPLAEQDFVCYTKEVQREIVKVRPGLTGVGSIVFRDEEQRLSESDLPPLECYREEIAPRKGALEVWYVQRNNLLLDIKLLLLTIVAVIMPSSRLHERVLDLPDKIRH